MHMHITLNVFYLLFFVNVVAGRLVVWNRRAARQAQVAARLAPRAHPERTTKHKSCHLLLLICMSFDEQSSPIQTRSLCARKRRRKKYPSFAIEAQQDKHSALCD
jgi:hypothetical protein